MVFQRVSLGACACETHTNRGIEMPFDPNLPVRCRNGEPARILCTDRDDPDYPIVALLGNDEEPDVLTKHGCFHLHDEESGYDLVNYIPKKTGWINIYSDSTAGGRVYESKDAAIKGRIEGGVTIKIEWE